MKFFVEFKTASKEKDPMHQHLCQNKMVVSLFNAAELFRDKKLNNVRSLSKQINFAIKFKRRKY